MRIQRPSWTWVAIAAIAAAVFIATVLHADAAARNWVLGFIAAVGAVAPGLVRLRRQKDDDDDPPANGASSGRITPVMISMLALALSLFLTGCGGAPTWAQRVVTTSSAAVVEVDQVAAGRYLEAGREALDAAQTPQDYEHDMRHWNALEEAMRTARSSLLALQAAVDTWDVAGREGLDTALPCLLQALARVGHALVEAGVNVPQKLADALALGGALTRGSCAAAVAS